MNDEAGSAESMSITDVVEVEGVLIGNTFSINLT